MESRGEDVTSAERAAGYLAELAVPRLVGTEMELKTAGRIEEHFRSLGLVVERERFEFGSRRRWLWKALTILLPLSLFVCLFLLGGAPVLSFLWSAAIIGLFSYMTRNTSKVGWLAHGWGKKIKSQNIIATKKPESKSEPI